MDHAALRAYADLIAGFGANVQSGQDVSLLIEPGKEPLARLVAEACYRRGARFVDLQVFDPWLKRARIEHAPEDTLDYVPSWIGERILALGEQRAARIMLSGASAPEALEGVDPVKAGRDRLPATKESGQVVNDRTTNWTIAGCPTPGWAKLVFPDLPADEAVEKLWQLVLHVCRLDEDDPIAAWQERSRTLSGVAERLTAHGLDALRYHGPGTDLTVGLLPEARFMSAAFSTADGVPHFPNIPSEEVFTTPDPARADGEVRATKPLVLTGGTVVDGLRVRFEGGRAVEITADRGGETFATVCDADAGGRRLGEVALVDREGRIGALDTVFYDTLYDENAASHIAVGKGFDFLVPAEHADRVNDSAIHIDFMIGTDDVDVTGITAAGDEVPVLRGGSWCI